MRTYSTEVFDSLGTLAVQGQDGQDVAHLSWTDRDTAADEHAEPSWRELSDEERQIIIDRVSFVLSLTDAELGLLRSGLDSHAYWQLSEPAYRNSGYVIPPGTTDPEASAELEAVTELDNKLAALQGTV